MEWTEEDQKLYDSIVDNLRRQGWSREDATEEADIKLAKIVDSRTKKKG